MSINYILILSNKELRTEKLISLFKREEFEVEIVEKIAAAVEIIASSEIAVFLINYNSILNTDRKVLVSLFKDVQKTNFILYDVPTDAIRRLAFYRLGAYRILDKNYKDEEIFYYCNNLLTHFEDDAELKESYFKGNLEDFNLAGLINIFGREKRSGLLRIQTPVSTGKIYFNSGDIYHAVAGHRRDDEAVLYMLTWNKGWFNMRPLPVKMVKNRVQLSNIGLLLHGEDTRNQFFDKVTQLGGLTKQYKVVNQGDLLLNNREEKYTSFIENLSEFREIYRVIEISPFAMTETLDKLLEIKKTKNLEARETADAVEDLYLEKAQDTTGLRESVFSTQEIGQLRRTLNAVDLNRGKLLILGTNTSGKSEFVRNLHQSSQSKIPLEQDLDFTKIELTKDFYLLIFGLALDKKITETIAKLSEGLLSYVFLIDAQHLEEIEYTNYVINHLVSLYNVPWAIAVTNLDKNNNKLLSKVKAQVRLPDDRALQICDVKNREEVRQIIKSISPTKQKLTKEKEKKK
jgi:signal recognition particle receptor subunit beta